MVHRDFFVFLESDAIQVGSQSEYARFYAAQFEVRAERFFVETEFPVLQFFCIIRKVPGHQFEVVAFQFAGQGADFLYLLPSHGCVGLQ